jgi:hypothetical protein
MAVARRIGPLFGLYDADSPYHRSWVVDVRRVLVKELAQGRPDKPSSKVADGNDGEQIKEKKSLAAPTGEKPLAPATISKFGPDPRAAMVLEGVNQILAPRAKELWKVLKFELDWTHEHTDMNSNLGQSQVSRALAFWAIGIGELWSSYPALLWAGFWARSLQLSGDFDIRFAQSAADTALPSEFGFSPKRFEKAPTSLSIVDDVLENLQNHRYPSGTPVVSRRDLAWFNDASDKLADVITAVAQEDGNHPGIVWIPPLPNADERVATAYLVPIHIVQEFARRHNIDQGLIATAWDDWAESASERLSDAAQELSRSAFALYARILEVALEWSSRGEKDSRLSLTRHAEIQETVAQSARATLLSPAAPTSDSVTRDELSAMEAIVLISETRAEACRVRELTERSDSAELREAASRLLAHLDGILAGTTARRLPTGPALAQLSRGTSDVFEAMRKYGGSHDAFWTGVHAKVWSYWDEYKTKLSEGISADGSGGPIGHYLGNIAGYLAETSLAPDAANKEVMLEQALDLLRSQIIPYRKRRAGRRADWEEFLVRGYLQGAECVCRLAELAHNGPLEPASYNQQLASDWLQAVEEILDTPRVEHLEMDAILRDKHDALLARLKSLHYGGKEAPLVV